MSRNKKPQSPKLIPTGETNALSTEQRRRVQALWVARRALPAGDLKAHNLELLARFILGRD